MPVWVPVLLGLLVVAGLVTFQLLRPLPAVAASTSLPESATVAGGPVTIPWPAQGSAALAVTGLGMIGTSGQATPKPIASVAKIMTALLVLQDKPLQPKDQGPAITVDQDDVTNYNTRQAAGESVVKVTAGEQISEYQALQGLLLPSGNNLADMLAKWDAGSVPAMVAKMNAKAKALHLTGTTYADTSGISAQTASTATDQTILAEAAMNDAVFGEIVAQPQAELPVAGVVYNVDYVVGQDGIVGVKTGSSPDANSNFVFAANALVRGRAVRIFGAVLGQQSLDAAFKATKALLDSVRSSLQLVHAFGKDQAISRYQAPWGSHTDVLTTASLDLVGWPETTMRMRVETRTLNAPLGAGADAGSVLIRLGDQQVRVPLKTADPLPAPGMGWRLTRLG